MHPTLLKIIFPVVMLPVYLNANSSSLQTVEMLTFATAESLSIMQWNILSSGCQIYCHYSSWGSWFQLQTEQDYQNMACRNEVYTVTNEGPLKFVKFTRNENCFIEVNETKHTFMVNLLMKLEAWRTVTAVNLEIAWKHLKEVFLKFWRLLIALCKN
jgi:hypothetical protein